MKLKTKILTGLIILVLLYVANYFWLKLTAFKFTGILLGVLLFGGVAANFLFKYIDRHKKQQLLAKGYKPTKPEDSFIFPRKIAKKMKGVDIGIQYESTVLAIAFLIVGMIAFSIYFVFFTDFNWAIKGIYIFNSICGVVLMTSMLITNYQQYVYYKQSISQILQIGAEQ